MLKDEQGADRASRSAATRAPTSRCSRSRASGFPLRQLREPGQAAGRRLGDGGGQSVQPRRHGHGRHRLGLGRDMPDSIILRRLHADRRAHQPRQFRRPDLRHLRPGDRGQHRDLLALRRLGGHRLRHSRRRGRRRHQAADRPRQDRPRLHRRQDPERHRRTSPAAWASSRARAPWSPELVPGGPADSAGLQAGDVVLDVNGQTSPPIPS